MSYRRTVKAQALFRLFKIPADNILELVNLYIGDIRIKGIEVV